MVVMTDIGASILARLKNRGKATATGYQQCLQLFFQEEFLRRMSKSPYASNLILKGGLFIYTLADFKSRATVDIDFMVRHIDNNPEYMEKVIAEIIDVPTGLNETVILEASKCTPIGHATGISWRKLPDNGKNKKSTSAISH